MHGILVETYERFASKLFLFFVLRYSHGIGDVETRSQRLEAYYSNQCGSFGFGALYITK